MEYELREGGCLCDTFDMRRIASDVIGGRAAIIREMGSDVDVM